MMKSFIFQQQQQQQQQGIEENMSNLTSASGEASASSGTRTDQTGANYPQQYFTTPSQSTQPVKKKRNLPGNPDPDAEVIAMSPKSLLATNRFVCEICNKGFQRDQNLQLHRRGHNLPWKLKQRTNKEVRKKVYVCPEPSCVHHDPSRALGDLTGIKKHYCRKHGERKWKCDKCSKRYAVQSDWKAHSKICGTREYRCDCGTLFSRRDSFVTHRAFCDALAVESTKSITANPLLSNQAGSSSSSQINFHPQFNLHQDFHASFPLKKEDQNFSLKPTDNINIPPWLACQPLGTPRQQAVPLSTTDISSSSMFSTRLNQELSQQTHQDLANQGPTLPHYQPSPPPHMSATALLQRAAQMGATMSSDKNGPPSSQAMNNNNVNMIRPHQQQGQSQGYHAAAAATTHVSADQSSGKNNTTTGFALNLSSSREGLSSYGNKAPTTIPNANALQDMMTSLSSAAGFEGTSIEDAFGGIFSSKKDGNVQENLSRAAATAGHLTTRGNEGAVHVSEEMTRDFLGLRHLSHSDILNIAGLSNCMNTSSQGENQSQNQKPWQG